MRYGRSVWILLGIGIALRCVALHQPLLDAHPLRQCQTAAATRSLIEEGSLLTSHVPWLGDLDARYVMELPVYNYLVATMHLVIRDLDVAGRLTSILLWAASFLCLQSLWRRLLAPAQAWWANLLFVLAPLGVFFGQAFMPEMLIQLLSFAFVLLLLRYDEEPSLTRWVLCVAVGLVGLLIKLPAFGHLYLILAYLVIRQEGWSRALRPRYLAAALITLVAIKGWGSYVDAVNAVSLPEWSASDNLRSFIGPLSLRFQWRPWAMGFMYVAVFLIPGPALLAALAGLWRVARRPVHSVLPAWIISLAVFYLFWFGNGAVAQSYYNLPALAPLCACFGIGLNAWLTASFLQSWRRPLAVAAVLLVLLPAIPVWRYLFQQDDRMLAAAHWVEANTQPNDVILSVPNHRWDFVNYPYNAIMPYYSRRPTFVLAGHTAEKVRTIALARSSIAVVTLPPGPPPGGLVTSMRRLRGSGTFVPALTAWLEESGFQKIAEDESFVVYQRK